MGGGGGGGGGGGSGARNPQNFFASGFNIQMGSPFSHFLAKKNFWELLFGFEMRLLAGRSADSALAASHRLSCP